MCTRKKDVEGLSCGFEVSKICMGNYTINTGNKTIIQQEKYQ